MATTDVEVIETALRKRWSFRPSVKAKRYVGKFVNATRTGKKITAQVEGNHGRYTVSIEAEPDGLTSACSCYIGKGGFCHHCEALAHTFLQHHVVLTPVSPIFKAVREKQCKAWYIPARRSLTAPESALVRGSEPSDGDRLGGPPQPPSASPLETLRVTARRL